MRPGQPFIRKFDRIVGITKPHHHVKITSDIRKEIRIWLAFLQGFNGVSLVSPLTDVQLATVQFQSDASGWGCVAVCRDN